MLCIIPLEVHKGCTPLHFAAESGYLGVNRVAP